MLVASIACEYMPQPQAAIPKTELVSLQIPWKQEGTGDRVYGRTRADEVLGVRC